MSECWNRLALGFGFVFGRLVHFLNKGSSFSTKYLPVSRKGPVCGVQLFKTVAIYIFRLPDKFFAPNSS